METMKISIKSHNVTWSCECSPDATIGEVLCHLRTALIGIGFSIKNALIESEDPEDDPWYWLYSQ